MPNGETGDFIESRRGICLEHFSIRLTSTLLSSPGLTRSRACPTSALLNDRNRKHPISIGDPVNTDRGLLDCPVNPRIKSGEGNDTGRVNLIGASLSCGSAAATPSPLVGE